MNRRCAHKHFFPASTHRHSVLVQETAAKSARKTAIMRSSSWETPPRPHVKSRRDMLPRLTPSSSDGSSSTGTPPSPSPSRSRQGDRRILRGAAVVRERILSRMRSPESSFDEEDDSTEAWSDPFTNDDWKVDHSESFEEEMSSSTYESFSQLPMDEANSWVDRALQDSPPSRHRGPLDTNELNKKPSQELPPPASRPPSPAGSDGTPVTAMGRGRSLRVKMVTYHVQPSDEIGDDSTYDGSYLMRDDESKERQTSYIPEKWATLAQVPKEPQGPKPLPHRSQGIEQTPSGISTLSPSYGMLVKDQAYLHACSAGYLWQTLVGQHVRFPSSWWDGARGPQMGLELDRTGRVDPAFSWQYVAKTRVSHDSTLMHLVRNRSSPGRLILHIVVRDLMTWAPVQDVAIGTFHPSARGVRSSDKANPKLEDCRDVWMAVRRRTTQQDAVSVVEPLLFRGDCLEDISNQSPLGNKRKITNNNMRAVRGVADVGNRCCFELDSPVSRTGVW